MTTKLRVSAEEREKMIAEAAYYRALGRGFEDDNAIQDWLDAEREIDAKFGASLSGKKLVQFHVQLTEVNERLRELVARLKHEAREEWDEEVERMHRLRDVFSEKLSEIQGLAGEARHRAKRQADKLWKELVRGLEEIGRNIPMD